jgi:hypothetical protein
MEQDIAFAVAHSYERGRSAGPDSFDDEIDNGRDNIVRVDASIDRAGNLIEMLKALVAIVAFGIRKERCGLLRVRRSPQFAADASAV